MCGRFFIAEEGEDELLALMIEEASRRQQAIVGESAIARGEVFPSAAVAAMAMSRKNEIGAYPLQWGFHRRDGKGLVINTRSETALEKPLFRQSMLERRCLIPCSWYFEWGAAQAQPSLLGDDQALSRAIHGLKIKYAIRPRRPGRMYLAAIYRYEEGQRLPVFSILTREPAKEIAFIHDRMPVIFSDGPHRAWLDRGADPQRVLQLCEQEMTFRTA